MSEDSRDEDRHNFNDMGGSSKWLVHGNERSVGRVLFTGHIVPTADRLH